MRIKYCSITGADDEVDIEHLSIIAKKHPFVEWAVLLLPEWEGQPRFPTMGWIRTFVKKYRGENIALHFCGQALLDFIAGKEAVLELMSGFGRIQLNLEFGNMEGKFDPAALTARVKSFSGREFIIQYGRDRESLLSLLKDMPNHAVLFDKSAGSGFCPDSWDAPLKGHFCGYAGGLTPDNLKRNLGLISCAAAGQTTWIDMESGVRTNDRFDLEKVCRVLEIAKGYI